MIKEQEAMKYIEKRIKVCNENADICDDNNFDEEATYLREESYMLETLLSMLKEKDSEIERLEYIKKSFDYVVQKETENKDKQIDLMAEMIDELSEFYTRYFGKNNEFCKEDCINKDIDCKDCIKQYFERKSKE